ncbi:DnaJ domain-containing protein [Papiliotrema laurentii]|uniref:DnaJ domain-containing protein n=1 Tax=Papiliotrema laurentii TaxID=5418 RepID=A0AAD9FS48_PAPLA|nr:DnaJ domain-containing protein [Papiliotrema laurentii]
MATTYYELLGVGRDATGPEIRKAYLQLAAKSHPDKTDDPDATARFQLINEAYTVLSDPEQRARYDEKLKRASKAPKTPPQPSTPLSSPRRHHHPSPPP